MIQKKVSGITLIEVLITILVMAVGMLGVAALQVKALNTSQESYSKSQAVAVVEGMADLMRSEYRYIHDNEQPNNTYSNTDWCSTPPTECTTSTCSEEEVVKTNVAQACKTLESAGIPDSKMGVKCIDKDGSDTDTCSPGSLHAIYVSWKPGARKDTDGEEYSSSHCSDEFPAVLDATDDCVVIELVP